MTTAAVEAPLDLRAAYRRFRLPVALVSLLIGTALIIAWIESGPPQRPLDPRDASPVGGRALAQLLDDRGIDDVAVAPGSAASSAATATTVFLPDPRSLALAQLQAISDSGADIVVVAPTRAELTALSVPARPVRVGGGTLSPACNFSPAAVAGAIRYDGVLYEVSAPGAGCYSLGSGQGLVSVQRGAAGTVVFGSASALANDRLGDEGNAALGLGLLDTQPRLVWVVPQPPTKSVASGERKSLIDLLPRRLLWALLDLLVAIVLVALWRARRLGPVVPEPLPVVVRATETVEGRARLLRGARARGHAASALRTAAANRLRDTLGLAQGAAPQAVVETISRRTGDADTAVSRVLYGDDPSDDDALVQLADDLDKLEQRVRNS